MSSVKQAGIAEITNQLEYDDEVAFLANRQIFDWTRYRRGQPFSSMFPSPIRTIPMSPAGAS